MLRAKLIGILAMMSVCVACGGGNESSNNDKGDGGGSGGGTNKIDACNLVTQTDANSLFGQTATKDTGVGTPDPGLIGQCVWNYDNSTDNSSELLQIQIYDKDTYYSEPSGATPFAIGDKGYVSVGGLAGVDVGWVQDGKTLTLSYSTIGPSVPEASTKAEDVKTLAKKVESAL
jgi:hypothetical protein